MTLFKTVAAAIVIAMASALAAHAQTVPANNASLEEGQNAVATYFTGDSVGDVQLGRLGLAKSRNASVRALASAMVRDHTMTARRGWQVARAIGDSDVKFKPGDDNQIELSRLARYSGAAFDREYVKTLIEAHKVDISTGNDALDFVTNAQLRAYLQTTLAVDHKHLSMAEAIR